MLAAGKCILFFIKFIYLFTKLIKFLILHVSYFIKNMSLYWQNLVYTLFIYGKGNEMTRRRNFFVIIVSPKMPCSLNCHNNFLPFNFFPILRLLFLIICSQSSEDLMTQITGEPINDIKINQALLFRDVRGGK